MNEVSEGIMAILRRKAVDPKHYHSSPHSITNQAEMESLVKTGKACRFHWTLPPYSKESGLGEALVS